MIGKLFPDTGQKAFGVRFQFHKKGASLFDQRGDFGPEGNSLTGIFRSFFGTHIYGKQFFIGGFLYDQFLIAHPSGMVIVRTDHFAVFG